MLGKQPCLKSDSCLEAEKHRWGNYPGLCGTNSQWLLELRSTNIEVIAL